MWESGWKPHWQGASCSKTYGLLITLCTWSCTATLSNEYLMNIDSFLWRGHLTYINSLVPIWTEPLNFQVTQLKPRPPDYKSSFIRVNLNTQTFIKSCQISSNGYFFIMNVWLQISCNKMLFLLKLLDNYAANITGKQIPLTCFPDFTHC